MNTVQDNFLTIRAGTRLLSLRQPLVMGIINVTPDSFYSASRIEGSEHLRRRVRQMLSEGVDIIDLGGYSSRPGAADVSAEEEYGRLASALEIVREEAPDAILSVDTFRADVARKCVKNSGVQIINDIGGGTLDSSMFETVAELKVAYVLMHTRGNPSTMNSFTDYNDVTADVLSDLAFKAYKLRELGVCDIILDPGFGFAKTTRQNFRLLDNLQVFRETGMPVIVGLSRKSMIWKTLKESPEEALEGTTALNMVALTKGADILRVHDVKAAKDCVKLYCALREASGVETCGK